MDSADQPSQPSLALGGAAEWAEFMKLWQSEITALQQSPQALTSMQLGLQQWLTMLATLPTATDTAKAWPTSNPMEWAELAKSFATFGASPAGSTADALAIKLAELEQRVAKLEAHSSHPATTRKSRSPKSP